MIEDDKLEEDALLIRVTFMCAAEGIESVDVGLAKRLGADQKSIEWTRSDEDRVIHLDLRIPFSSAHDARNNASIHTIPDRIAHYFADRASVRDKEAADLVGFVDIKLLEKREPRPSQDVVKAAYLGTKTTDQHGIEREHFVAIVPADLKRRCHL